LSLLFWRHSLPPKSQRVHFFSHPEQEVHSSYLISFLRSGLGIVLLALGSVTMFFGYDLFFAGDFFALKYILIGILLFATGLSVLSY
jgi:hypothetical protein